LRSRNTASSNPPQKEVTRSSSLNSAVMVRSNKTNPHSAQLDRNEMFVVKSVMIVDDNRAVRKALCEFFTAAGDFSACGEAENGREAIEKAQRLHPDLIVTDLAMPVLNGLEEARLLKQLMPTVPVIIYTVHSGLLEKEARLAGASAVVSKSESVATLIATARTLANKVAA
jgi:DNA-binding NarL/FixJ family response regulator